ncbi:SRPBCC family protein [Zeaxanthinibacter sp. PT1]|uniref:SRPBCC family protein n=1 Tax=Zeaxanthinibacter TaxID=561554 RepID=UPI002349D64A|nr:SRPBCC family protein [Zeaxanthinibacter sp. PT1]MDC6351814.1 SRPBCC family protein [Zeaxanthinibacter sp. PT1]
MQINTTPTTVNKSAKELYDFLTKLENFEEIMPDNLDKFQLINENRFLFGLKGMPEIVLERKEQLPNQKLVLGAASDKLPFTLTAHITAVDENQSEISLAFDGDFNAMMAMMIKGPITNFLNTLSKNLGEL